MAKHYSEKFLLKLTSLNPKRLGVQFGKVCVKANLPPSMIADTVGVTRQTVHNWFRGGPIRERNIGRVEKFIDLLDQYLEVGELPVSTTIQAKEFISTKVIDKL
jgi:hypothetical protein